MGPQLIRARAHVHAFVDRVVSEREVTWARLVRKGWAVYTEEDGVLGVSLTDAGEARAAELRSRDRQGNN